MKYILMYAGEEWGRYKSLAKAKEAAEREGQYHNLLEFTILEVMSEFEFTGETKFTMKEKEF